MKLNELLSVNENLKTQADKTRSELAATFTNKRHHFSESIQTFTPNTENAASTTEAQLDLQTTVKKELKWIAPFLAKALDSANKIAVANTQAKADVVLETGETLLTGVPATSLLELGKRVNELLEFAKQIPTLDPAKGFQVDPQRGEDVFKARDVVKVRTAKQAKVLTLAPATDKHPAQAQLVSEDVPTGVITVREWSGLITTTEKGQILERIEVLARAVAKARARANDTEVPGAAEAIGDTLIKYAFGV